MKPTKGLLADWKQEERGWWVSSKPMLGVCKERDGKWHSYISTEGLEDNTPGFKTMREAMMNAEMRYKKKEGEAMKKLSFIQPGVAVRLRSQAKAEIYAIKPRQHWKYIGAIWEDGEWVPCAWNSKGKASDDKTDLPDDIVGIWSGGGR